MNINQSKNLICVALAGFLVFAGCSGGKLRTGSRSGKLLVPAGVDSSVAIKADTLADNLFVSFEREKRSERFKAVGKNRATESDTLWKYLSNELDPGLKISQENQAKAVEAFNKGAVSLQKLSEIDQNAQDAYTKIKIENLLLDAKKNFERAVVLNPFDLETRSWLARVYQTLAIRFLDEKNNARAINVLENLVRIEKGEHTLFARLAEAYYAIQNWSSAHYNFQKAESVMRSAAGLDFSENIDYNNAPVDTAALFYYVYYQGDSEIKMHDAERGLASLNRALKYAATEQERANIHSYIDWINWDDGNTKGVELRDKYIALQADGKNNDAAKGFLKLIPQLRTQRARDEITWRLAVIEFQFLSRQNEGIDRLKDVVRRIPKLADGAPVDTSYQRYFDSYGIMCHNLGLENFKKNRKFAFMYFQQSVTVNWENRAKSHLEIAKMSRNNPKAVIESCEGALRDIEQLDGNEQMQVYQLLVEALKRSGRFDEARRYYAIWMQMRNSTRRASR